MINKAVRFRKRVINNQASPAESQIVRAERLDKQNAESKMSDILLEISNQDSRYRLKFGQDFNHLLDARDHVLEHQFSFSFENTGENVKEGEDVLESQLYSSIKKRVKEFLSQAVGNIVSIGFKFLCKTDLEDAEAKEMASKNIMLNIYSIFRETIKAIAHCPALKEALGEKGLKEVKEDLVVQVDNILHNILINLADSYPQAPASGGTPRMKEAINEINRMDDEQNDFLLTSGIKIADYLKLGDKEMFSHYQKIIYSQDEDYTDFIMDVINAAIEVTHDNSEDARERTIFEKFSSFNEHLFWLAQQKDFQQILGQAEASEKENFGSRLNFKEKRIENAICKKVDGILTNEKKAPELEVAQQCEELNRLWEKSEDGIADLKMQKGFALGKKIPASVKPFKRHQIASKQFSAKHSSILRILTKWAMYLEDIFKHPEEHVEKKLYPLKNIKNELVSHSEGNNLVARIRRQHVDVKQKFDVLLQTSYQFMAKFLSQESGNDSVVYNINRFTETRVVSSKINVVLVNLMVNYTNLLIHHLLKAGQKLQLGQLQNVNLIGFRVTDLMRSKFQCSEASFINVLKTMYLLDQNQSMKNKFKLVRIKNKLDDPANNILINYLFMGKVQCELQLSIQEAKGKEKNFYTFSHFVYQLTRGRFGSIAECAIMISQLDPMITACKKTYYEEKQQILKILPKICQIRRKLKKKRQKKEKKEAEIKMQKDRQKNINQIQQNKVEFPLKKVNAESQADSKQNSVDAQSQIREREVQLYKQVLQNQDSEYQDPQDSQFKRKINIFECKECQKLITNEHPQKIATNEYKQICYKCMMKNDPQQKLVAKIRLLLQNRADYRLKQYSQLKKYSFDKYLVCLNKFGQLSIHIVPFLQNQLKTFMIKVDKDILQAIGTEQFNFDTLDYIDISNKIRKAKNHPDGQVSQLIYCFFQSIPIQILEELQIKDLFQNKIRDFLRLFQRFRKQKNIIKTIKFNAQIIKTQSGQWKIVDKVCRQLVMGQEAQEKDSPFLYKKYKSLNLTNLKQITVNNVGLMAIPNWISKCPYLTLLVLRKNMINVVKKQELPPTLAHLDLQGNKMSQIDISHLRNLNFLHLWQNKLQTIDVSNSTKISVLYLGSNLLTSFKLGDNHSIVKLLIFDNRLSEIDLGTNNTLKLLNISNNRNLENIPNIPLSLEQLHSQQSLARTINFKPLVNLQKVIAVNKYMITREGKMKQVKKVPSFQQSITKQNIQTLLNKTKEPLLEKQISFNPISS